MIVSVESIVGGESQKTSEIKGKGIKAKRGPKNTKACLLSGADCLGPQPGNGGGVASHQLNRFGASRDGALETAHPGRGIVIDSVTKGRLAKPTAEIYVIRKPPPPKHTYTQRKKGKR